MEEVEIHIEAKVYTARATANLLLSLATMRDALALAWGREYVDWNQFDWWNRLTGYYPFFVDPVRGPIPFPDFLIQVGSDLLLTGKRPIEQLQVQAETALLSFHETVARTGYGMREGLELRGVTRGSIVIRIKEWLEAIEGQLLKLLGSTESLVGQREQNEYYRSAAEVIHTANPELQRKLAAGLLAVSGLTLERTLEQVQAQRVRLREPQ